MGKERYYPGLDGLRGVAAICVVLLHRGVWFHLHGWLAHGYLAVDFFFMLSGFVVANAYEEKLKSGLSFTEFLRLRAIRLYPLILLGTSIGAAWALISTQMDGTGPTVAQAAGLFARGALAVPTLAHNPVGVGVFPLDAPAWSLFFELTANLAYAMALRWMTTRRLIVVVLLSGAALAWVALSQGGIDKGGTPATFWGGFPRTAFPFFFGVLLFRLRHWRPIQWPSTPVPLQAALLVTVLNIPGGLPPLVNGVIDLACVALAFPVVIALSIRSRPTGAVERHCLYLGALSYPLYILHYPIYVVLGGLGYYAGLLDRSSMTLFGFGALAVILAVSQASLSLYDKPVRRWLGGSTKPRVLAAAPRAEAEAAAGS